MSKKTKPTHNDFNAIRRMLDQSRSDYDVRYDGDGTSTITLSDSGVSIRIVFRLDNGKAKFYMGSVDGDE